MIRQYAAKRLQDKPDSHDRIRDAHAAYYVSFLKAKKHSIKTTDGSRILDEIESEFGNIREVWYYAVSNLHIDHIDESSDTLLPFFRARGRLKEGDLLLKCASDAVRDMLGTGNRPLDPHMSLYAKILRHRAIINARLGRYDIARSLLEDCAKASDQMSDQKENALRLSVLGDIEICEGKYDEAKEVLLRCIESARILDFAWLEAYANVLIAGVFHYRGDQDAASSHFEEGLAIGRGIQDMGIVIAGLSGLAGIAYICGDLDTALRKYQESIDLARKLGDTYLIGALLGNLGSIQSSLGRMTEAKNLYEEFIEIAERSGSDNRLGRGFYLIGSLHSKLNQHGEADRCLRQSIAIFDRIGAKRFAAFSRIALADELHSVGKFEHALELCRQSVERFESIGDQVGKAQSLQGVGRNLLEMGSAQSAMDPLCRALKIAWQLGNENEVCATILDIASCYELSGELIEAVKLYSLVSSLDYMARPSVESPENSLDRLSRMVRENDYREATESARSISLEQVVASLISA